MIFSNPDYAGTKISRDRDADKYPDLPACCGNCIHCKDRGLTIGASHKDSGNCKKRSPRNSGIAVWPIVYLDSSPCGDYKRDQRLKQT